MKQIKVADEVDEAVIALQGELTTEEVSEPSKGDVIGRAVAFFRANRPLPPGAHRSQPGKEDRLQ